MKPFLAIFLTFLLAPLSPIHAAEPTTKAEAFKAMRYGIFIHNVYKLTGTPQGVKYENPEEFAKLFDVKEFANQMEACGVEYVFFTAWHLRMYMLGPNAALDKWLPGHTTRRDLVGELADALAAKGIALVIYAHPNDGHDLTPEEQAKVGYVRYDKADPKPIPVFNDFINDVYSDLSERYAKKPNVIGFWWDSWWQNGNRIDIQRLRDTVRAKFPAAVILSNNGHNKKCVDFYSAECGYKQTADNIDNLVVLLTNQTSTFQGTWWRNGDGTASGKPAFSPETLFRFTVLNAGGGAPGGICWASSPLADGKTWGSDGEPLQTLIRLGSLLKPVREAVTSVAPSRNWLLPDKTIFSSAPPYVATRSLDGTKEYVHVLKSPTGKSVELTPPVEEFRAARLLKNGHPVAIRSEAQKMTLTLEAEDSWDPLDTVIVLERALK